MPDVNALNYLALQDAVLGRRFPAASQRTNSKRWLATAYNDVWTATDWTFKRLSRQSLAVVGGNGTPVMPADFADVIRLYDQYGDPLTWLSEEQFEDAYADSLMLGTVGPPAAFTVVNRQIQLAPLPDVSATYKLSYKRRLCSKTSAGSVQAGMMNLDGDFPLWDDHHSVLIPRAVSIGLQELNDPTWQEPQEEYERQLSRMKDDYEQTKPQQQWGKVTW